MAREFSKRLDIAHTELDSIYHQENWQSLDNDTLKNRIYKIANEDQWIICGNHLTKLGLDLWHNADTVIWCDYSLPLIFSRLVRRTLMRGATRAESWNGNRERLYVNFFTNDSVLVWMMRSWNKLRNGYTKLFNEPDIFPSTSLIRLRNPKQTSELLKGI